MDRIVIHLTDPWTGRDVARDVTGLSRARLERYARVAASAEFRELAAEFADRDATPGELLAAWVERVGPVHAGVAILRRRVVWINIGAALGLAAGALLLGGLLGFPPAAAGDENVIVLLRAYLQHAMPQLAGTVLTWLVLVVFFAAPILLGLLLGAGAGWFAAGLIDAWEHARGAPRVRKSN